MVYASDIKTFRYTPTCLLFGDNLKGDGDERVLFVLLSYSCIGLQKSTMLESTTNMLCYVYRAVALENVPAKKFKFPYCFRFHGFFCPLIMMYSYHLFKGCYLCIMNVLKIAIKYCIELHWLL